MEEVVFSPLPETEFAITATSQSKGSGLIGRYTGYATLCQKG